MRLTDWIQFVVGVSFLFAGVAIFCVEIWGVFKFRYVMNRMHAAATGDTLGIGASLLGIMILNGFNFTSLKMGLVIIFLWLASPVSSHLIARLEATTNEHLKEFCELPEEEKKEEK